MLAAINNRWLKTYYQSEIFPVHDLESVTSTTFSYSQNPLDPDSRFHLVKAQTKIIENYMCRFGSSQFTYYLGKLQEVTNFIKDSRSFLCVEVLDTVPVSSETLCPEPVCPIGQTDSGQGSSEQTGSVTSRSPKIATPKRARGRPRQKKRQVTALGLNYKDKSCPVIFNQKTIRQKQQIILKAVLKPSEFNHFLNEGKNIFCKKDLKVNSQMSTKLLDDFFFNSLLCFKNLFTADACDFLKKFALNKRIRWKCDSCMKDLASRMSVGCDGCLSWYHMDCVNLNDVSESEKWYCNLCIC